MTPTANQKSTNETIRKGTAAFLLMFFLFLPVQASGRMAALTEDQMETVIAQSSISVLIGDYQFDWAADRLTIYDTDSDRSTNPNAGTISFNSLRLINGRIETDRAITFDAYTIQDGSHPMDGRTFTTLQRPGVVQEFNLFANNAAVCGQRIGGAGAENFRNPESYWTMGAHGSGMDFQYDVYLRTDRIFLAYNPSGATGLFALDGIHVTGSFADMDDFDIDNSATWDIPTNPSQWQRNGRFSIGNMDTGRPASLDVGASALGFELPMNGTVRVENLHFGAQDFGPIAIDNIRVHSLTLLVPGN